MQTNLNATQDANGFLTALDLNNNFISGTQIQNVRISEKFGPLVGFLATWTILGKSLTTNFEYRKDKHVSQTGRFDERHIVAKDVALGLEDLKIVGDNVSADILNMSVT